MKHSEKHNERIAKALLYIVPLLLLIPNVALGIMGNMSLLELFANIVLPAGMLLLVMSWGNRPGVNTLLLLPFMVLAAFQIVLLFLYSDGSIIGVDMFLNLSTTNSSEAKELLDNLKPAIITVVVLYLPAILLAVSAIRGKARIPAIVQSRARMAAVVFCVAGSVLLATCAISNPVYKIDEDFYPANVLANLGTAFTRSYDASQYHDNVGGKTWEVASTRPEEMREVYIAVVGETSRADNWQLFGYNRFTTPRLCSLDDGTLVAYPKVLSQSNTTHKSVPLLLSTLTVENFGDSLNHTSSVISMFRDAGYRTAYITTQCRNGSYIEYFAAEADTTIYLREPEPGVVIPDVFDKDMLAPLDSLLAREDGKLFVVMHQYGSHFNYADRYSREDAYFLPDKTANASASNRGQLVNAYDNSIRQTDEFLYNVIERLDSIGCVGGMVYTSDHGEDIFDDSRGRFLHASPTPTYYQLHVPFIVYATPQLKEHYPQLMRSAERNADKVASSSVSFTPTLLHMAGMDTPHLHKDMALTSDEFQPVTTPKFLSDRNRAESLYEAGFCSQDYERLANLTK